MQLDERAEQFFGLFPQEGRQGFRDHAAFLEQHEDEYRGSAARSRYAVGAAGTGHGRLEDTLPLVRRAKLIQRRLQFWMESNDASFVYWVERRGRGHVSAGHSDRCVGDAFNPADGQCGFGDPDLGYIDGRG